MDTFNIWSNPLVGHKGREGREEEGRKREH